MEYRVGIDLGGTGIKVGLVNAEKEIIKRSSLPTDAKRSFLSVTEDIVSAVRSVLEGIEGEKIVSVGIGCPGFVDPESGHLVYAGNLNWRNVPLQKELETKLQMPVHIGNDANCAVVGESLAGAAKGKRNVLMITLGTGVGGGVLLDGKLFTGSRGMGAELGHAILVYDGEACSCGIRGCFEAYASVTALIRQTKTMMEREGDSLLHEEYRLRGVVDGRTAFDAARKGDRAARKVLDQYIRYLAAGLGSQINIFRPEIVLIGGGLSAEKENLLAPLRAVIGDYVFAYKEIGAPEIRCASLGNDAGIIGAACLDLV